MAARHSSFFDFQRSGPNPHLAKQLADLATQRSDLAAEELAAIAPYEKAQQFIWLAGAYATIFALLLVRAFGFTAWTGSAVLLVPVLGFAVHRLAAFQSGSHRATYARWAEAIDDEEAQFISPDQSGWWEELVEGREQFVASWRTQWQAFRQGRGEYDLYLRDYCTSVGISWKDMRPKLEADFRDFFQFIQCERCELEVPGDNGKIEKRSLTLRCWLERRFDEDLAAGLPTTIREARDRRAQDVFDNQAGKDPDVVRFLAARAADEVTTIVVDEPPEHDRRAL